MVYLPTLRQQEGTFHAKYNRWQCAASTQQTVHDQDWHDFRGFAARSGQMALAMWQVVNCKNGISSYEIARAFGISQKSAWFMDHRIRCAFGRLRRSCPVKSRLTKHSSAVRPATCTSASGSGESPAQAARTKPQSWESLSVAARCAP